LFSLIYFYAHYGFASISAHALAMYTPFLIVVTMACSAAVLLAYFSNLSAGLTITARRQGRSIPAPILSRKKNGAGWD
jgi:hypothetical protein